MTLRRIAYFGTPEFAVPPLKALVEAGVEPGLVVSQPPRRRGRGMRLQPSPVATTARELRLPLAEVASVRDATFIEQLAALEPDLAVVAAFGQIFDKDLLGLPRLGCLNIHASLLPAWRGAAPIQAAIANGNSETGVSMMWMERGLDTGPVVSQRRLSIGADEIAPDLSRRLANLGAELLVETLHRLAEGYDSGQPQEEDEATYAPQLSRDDGRVDWSLTAEDLHNRWRAYQPWPGLFVDHDDEAIKLLRVTADSEPTGAAPGSVVSAEDGGLKVACADGCLAIVEARRPGRGTVSGRDLAAGLRLATGDRLGD